MFKSRMIRSISIALVLAGSALLLSACVKQPKPPLVFGATFWPGYEPIYLARELNYYDPTQVHLAEYSNGLQVLRGFQNRMLHVAAVTLDDALLLQQDIPDLRIILVLDASNGADALIAQADINTLQQLKGRRIGAEKTALGAIVLNLALDSVNMRADEVTVVPLALDEHESAFHSHQVDAVVTFEPVRTRLLRGDARQLFDSSQVPGKIIDVLVTRGEYIERYKTELALLVQGWDKARQYMQQEPEDALKIMAARERVSTMEFTSLLAGITLTDLNQNRNLLGVGKAELQSNAASMQEYLLKLGQVKRIADISSMFDATIIALIHP